MTETLADRFIASRGEPIDHDGQRVHLWFELPPLPAASFAISIAADAPRPQALCIEARGGLLEVAEQRSKAMALWTDVAPPVIKLAAIPGRSGEMTIRFWNAWRGDRDVMHSGIGNVGMLVAMDPNHLHLTCSDGWGPLTFGNLVADVSWTLN
ncbi:hypothetical protein G5T42_17155 [Microbacterium sp. 4R-513]|uniref:hypothetical protein n=1 Tax=Microbacterium sp. 4R-513 TaxID=2567934 RepID=UPI0013E168E5|nr:hypothetical protein [Microbacterium sp. 4R-513]QIG40987.1 hypothetical protein G5T42_17155 [Microbacterium sp. 4R-513]